jgi:hypothetical protein
MPRQKGIPKTGGRKPGSRNRTSEEIRQALLKLLDDNLETLQTDIKGLEGKDRVSLLISLAKHCTPPALNPEKLTEEQLEQIIDYLKEKENEKES